MQLHRFDFNLLQLQFVVLYYTGFFPRKIGALLFGGYLYYTGFFPRKVDALLFFVYNYIAVLLIILRPLRFRGGLFGAVYTGLFWGYHKHRLRFYKRWGKTYIYYRTAIEFIDTASAT